MATIIWTGGISGDWSVSGNWTGGVPTTGDDVYFNNNSVAVTAGLAQGSVTLASLNLNSTYTGTIGTLTSFLAISATKLQIGALGSSGQQGNNSQRININLGSNASTVTLLSSASVGADSGEPPIRLLGTVITLNALGGYVGIGTEATDSATCTAITTPSGGTSTIYVGSGTTVTTWSVASGLITDAANQAATTISQLGGRYNKTGSGAITTLNCYSGANFSHNGTGTITTANITGSFDTSGDGRAKTITTCNAFPGARIIAPLVVFTNGIALKGCKVSQISLDVGNDRTLGIT